MRNIKALNILVVEDDIAFATLAQQLLSDHTCQIASNGKEALKAFSAFQPDITFLDISLPDKSGYDILYEILKINPQAFVVMLTGSNVSDDVKLSIAMGAASYIVKPLSRKTIKKCIDKYLSKTQQHQKLSSA